MLGASTPLLSGGGFFIAKISGVGYTQLVYQEILTCMDAISHFTQQSMKKSVPELRPGDTVRVHQRIREGNKERIQVFEGVVLAVRGNKAINSSFVVRRIASGVGVEKTFPLHSPNVVKVERLKSSDVRQARLYYLRERFGRNARMRGEVRSTDAWHEGLVEDAATPDMEQSVEEVAEGEAEVPTQAGEEEVVSGEDAAGAEEAEGEGTENAEQAVESQADETSVEAEPEVAAQEPSEETKETE